MYYVQEICVILQLEWKKHYANCLLSKSFVSEHIFPEMKNLISDTCSKCNYVDQIGM